MIVDIAFIAFAIGGTFVFRFVRPATAVLIICFGGWILLPVGHYPPGSSAAEFPYWITGLAVPSAMLFTKAWIAPAVAVAGALLFDRRAVLSIRPRPIDVPIAAWCAWPLIQSLWADGPRPDAWLSSLYLAGSWGLPWLLGRAYFGAPDSQRPLAFALAFAGLACLPFSLLEGAFGPIAYEGVYAEAHPFRGDGAVRYFGYRPIGFFEHGNQFGVWISLCALAACWLAISARGEHGRLGAARKVSTWLAVIVTAMALAAQSIGGILLGLLGAALMSIGNRLSSRRLIAVGLTALLVGGTVYVSGVVPVMKIGRETALGQALVDGLRAAGRGSFAWRISQDQKLLSEATARPLVGQATWDWWRTKGTRPWGLWMLVLGQFGLVGLGAALGSLLGPALRTAWHAPRESGWREAALPSMLAVIVVLTVLDGLLNSFVFFPAILMAGALAGLPAVSGPIATGAVPPARP